MRRRLGDLALAGCLLLASFGYAVRWIDVTTFWLVALQALAPTAGLCVAVVTALAALARRRRLAAVGLAVTLVVGVVSAPAFVRSDAATPNPGDLVVLSANLRFGRADPDAVLAQVRGHRVDLLVLLEVTPATAARLDADGLDTLLPHEVGEARDGADGTLIRSRFPLTPVAAPTFPGETDLSQPAALADVDGRPLLVRAVHPFPPTPPNLDFWRSGLAGLKAWLSTQPDGIPVVLAGDFNASADHPVFRELAAGLVDAHQAVGSGWVRTWPTDSWAPAFVQIDHVLARGLHATGAGSVLLPGTDHAAVWASWSWPPG